MINVRSMVTILVPGATSIGANDVNDADVVVGSYDQGNGQRGFVYHGGTLTELVYPGATSTNLLGINNLGQIVGLATTINSTIGFFWDRGTFSEPLSVPNAALTVPNAINDRGEIVGAYQAQNGTEHPFFLKAGKFQFPVFPGSTEGSLEAVNASGHAIGDCVIGGATRGYSYLENMGTYSGPLANPNGAPIAMRAINNGGQVIGGLMSANGDERPFIFIGGQMHDIDFPNFLSGSINGLNNHGVVVGNLRTNGIPSANHTFLAQLAI
jgi:probable HAF family extracellular repeat protein